MAISIQNTVQYINNVACVIQTYFGLSTDTPKPTEGVGNGSAFIEMDTSKVYFFDVDNGTWLEWGAESASAGTLSASPSLPNSSQPINSGLNLGNTFQPSVIDPAVEEETIPDAEEDSEQDGEDA